MPHFVFEEIPTNGENLDVPRGSIDLTDETEDCTLTTTDEETDSSLQRQSRTSRRPPNNLTLASSPFRAQSCPNKYKLPSHPLTTSAASQPRLDRSKREPHIVNGNENRTVTNGHAEEGGGTSTGNYNPQPAPPRQRKRSRYAREEIAGVCYSVSYF